MRRSGRLVAWLLAALLALLAQPALAATPAIASSCHAYPASGETYNQLASRRAAWTCSDENWSASGEPAVLRFALGSDGSVPERLTTRLARFESSRIGIERRDGTIEWHPLEMADFAPYGQMEMVADLPEAGTAARGIVVEFTGATLSAVLSMATLHQAGSLGHAPDELYLAALCGLLIAPLLFNLAFYRVLRERFLLWHAIAVVSMLGHIVVTSGLARMVGGLPVAIVSYLVVTTFCCGTAAAMMLAQRFIETDKLDDRHRTAIKLAAAWVVLNCAIFVALIDQFQQLAVNFYYLAWLPVLAVLVWTLGTAVRRGSRAVWFQIAAWTPMILVGLARIIANSAGYDEPLLFYRAQDLAISIEVMVISTGIIDRFVMMRRDLDTHRARATHLADLAERDPLTGLLNRRAIENRFRELRAQGFATFAVLDLDRFKDINDRFGHAVGDRVLMATARALAASDDMVSMRLGGEEFVLLLRGTNACQHAEWCRRAIAARVATEVPGLDRLVTASMGLVEIPEDVMPAASFATVYARADGLLYQAKRGGRNRTVSERLTNFGKRRERKQVQTAA